MFYDRDEKEKGEDDISYNMNVGILVTIWGKRVNQVIQYSTYNVTF